MSKVPDYDKVKRRELGVKLVVKMLEMLGIPPEQRERLAQIHDRPQDFSAEERTEVYRLMVARIEEVAETALDPRRKKVGRDARAIAESLRTINRLAELEEARGEEVNNRQGKRRGSSPTWSEDG